METELSAERLKEAKTLVVEAALSLTRLKGKMRKACILWYVEGLAPAAAATAVKKPRQHVHRAITALRPRLEEVLAEVDRQSAKH